MLLAVRKGIFITAIVLSMYSFSGCVAVIAAGAVGASVAYIKGTLEINFDRPVKVMHKATFAALKDMKLMIKDQGLTQHNGFVLAEYPDGIKVKVSIEALTEKASKVKIRIGVFGDEQKSEMIVSEIRKKI